jgi:GNAT superfamily N-acetyltransferase
MTSTEDTHVAAAQTTITLPDGQVLSISRRLRPDPRELVLEAQNADGAVIADACCELDAGDATGHISVSVAPEWRNRGVGRTLLAQLVDEAVPLGLRFLVGRHTPNDVAASHMLAGTDAIVARRTGDGMVRFALAVPHRV